MKLLILLHFIIIIVLFVFLGSMKQQKSGQYYQEHAWCTSRY